MSAEHRVPALDGIRGIAVLGVVLYHLGHLDGGYLGVDAFFVLSGFLITGLLIDEAQRRRGDGDRPARIALGAFWVRRAKRLFPALLVVLAAVVVMEGWLLEDGLDGPTLRVETLSGLLYVYNWQAIANDVDYWAAFQAPSPLQHLWSLAIEEQFYVLWPLVVAGLVWWLAHRRADGSRLTPAVAIGVAAAVGAVASVLVAQLVHDPDRPLRVYYGTDTRIAAILFGAVAAALVRIRPVRTGRGRRMLGAAALVLVVPIAWAWIALDGLSPVLYRGGLVATGLATTVVVAAVVVSPRSPVARVASWGPLRWCGLVSYGLYLWHWPVIVWATPERTGVHGWPLLVVRVAVFTALTVVSYVLVEQPIRRSSPTGRRTVAVALPALVAVGGLAVVATVGASVVSERPAAGARSTEPIPEPPPTTAAGATVPAAGSTVTDPDGTSAPDPPDPRTTAADDGATTTAPGTDPPPPAPERVMVVGDSGAYFMGPLLEAAGPEVEVLQRGVVGCGIANAGGGSWSEGFGFLADPEGCAEWPERWSADAERFRPDVVLVLLGWPGIGDRDLEGARRHPCDPVFDAYYEERLELAVESAGAGGGDVTLVTVPYPVGDAGSELAVERVDCLNRSTTSVAARTGAVVVDLAGWVCPTTDCRREIDGQELRPDGVHFDGPGGELVAGWILDRLGAT